MRARCSRRGGADPAPQPAIALSVYTEGGQDAGRESPGQTSQTGVALSMLRATPVYAVTRAFSGTITAVSHSAGGRVRQSFR
jgi:hypothetical protein